MSVVVYDVCRIIICVSWKSCWPRGQTSQVSTTASRATAAQVLQSLSDKLGPDATAQS